MQIKVSNKHYCYYILTDMSKQEFEANLKFVELCKTDFITVKDVRIKKEVTINLKKYPLVEVYE